jgi:hypothetical protein
MTEYPHGTQTIDDDDDFDNNDENEASKSFDSDDDDDLEIKDSDFELQKLNANNSNVSSTSMNLDLRSLNQTGTTTNDDTSFNTYESFLDSSTSNANQSTNYDSFDNNDNNEPKRQVAEITDNDIDNDDNNDIVFNRNDRNVSTVKVNVPRQALVVDDALVVKSPKLSEESNENMLLDNAVGRVDEAEQVQNDEQDNSFEIVPKTIAQEDDLMTSVLSQIDKSEQTVTDASHQTVEPGDEDETDKSDVVVPRLTLADDQMVAKDEQDVDPFFVQVGQQLDSVGFQCEQTTRKIDILHADREATHVNAPAGNLSIDEVHFPIAEAHVDVVVEAAGDVVEVIPGGECNSVICSETIETIEMVSQEEASVAKQDDIVEIKSEVHTESDSVLSTVKAADDLPRVESVEQNLSAQEADDSRALSMQTLGNKTTYDNSDNDNNANDKQERNEKEGENISREEPVEANNNGQSPEPNELHQRRPISPMLEKQQRISNLVQQMKTKQVKHEQDLANPFNKYKPLLIGGGVFLAGYIALKVYKAYF